MVRVTVRLGLPVKKRSIESISNRVDIGTPSSPPPIRARVRVWVAIDIAYIHVLLRLTVELLILGGWGHLLLSHSQSWLPNNLMRCSDSRSMRISAACSGNTRVQAIDPRLLYH